MRKIKAIFDLLRTQENICKCQCGQSWFTYGHIDNDAEVRRSIIYLADEAFRTNGGRSDVPAATVMKFTVADEIDLRSVDVKRSVEYLKYGLGIAIEFASEAIEYTDAYLSVARPEDVLQKDYRAISARIVDYLRQQRHFIRRPFLNELVRTASAGYMLYIRAAYYLYDELRFSDTNLSNRPFGALMRFHSPTISNPHNRSCGLMPLYQWPVTANIIMMDNNIFIITDSETGLFLGKRAVRTVLSRLSPIVRFDDTVESIYDRNDLLSYVSGLSTDRSLQPRAAEECYKAAISILGLAGTRERGRVK